MPDLSYLCISKVKPNDMLIVFFSLALLSVADARILGFYTNSWNDPIIKYVGEGQIVLSPNRTAGVPWIQNMTNQTVAGTTGGAPMYNLWQQFKKFFRNEPEVITLTGFSRTFADDSLAVDAPELLLFEPELEPVYLELPLARSQLQLFEARQRENYRMFA